MDIAQALIAENAAFAELFRDADLSTPVPTCPEWNLGQLMRHVGRGDRWCAQIVSEQSMEAIDPRTVAGSKPPEGRTTNSAGYDGPQQLLDAVARTGADTPVWTFLGRARPSGGSADACTRPRCTAPTPHWPSAPGSTDPAVAADAITEYLERVFVRADAEGPAAGDRPGRRAVAAPARHRPRPGRSRGVDDPRPARRHRRRPRTRQGHHRAARPRPRPAAGRRRRGAAADLGLEIFGDPAIWDTWLARTPF